MLILGLVPAILVPRIMKWFLSDAHTASVLVSVQDMSKVALRCSWPLLVAILPHPVLIFASPALGCAVN